MKILICGGRDYTDYNKFRDKLEDIARERFPRTKPDEYGNYLYTVHIISGGARGADSLAIDWAVVNWCNFTEYKADWEKYGKAAGPIRNKEMLTVGKPDLVVAFPGSTGTAHMVKIAKEAGVEVIEVGD